MTDRIRRIYRRIYRFVIRCMNDNITVYSAMTTFFLVLSLIPFLMILMSLLRFLIPEALTALMQTILETLPSDIALPLYRVLNELFVVDFSSLLSITVFLALLAAGKGIMGLEQGMHVIYQVPLKGNYLIRRIRCTFYTIIVLGAILAASFLLVFGKSISILLQQNVSILAKMTHILIAFRVSISIGVFVVLFTLSYRALTGVHCAFFETLPGVLASTAGWLVFSAGYSFYIRNFSNYTYLYGSMGALILFLMWFYFCILILMIGAEINVELKNLKENKTE